MSPRSLPPRIVRRIPNTQHTSTGTNQGDLLMDNSGDWWRVTGAETASGTGASPRYIDADGFIRSKS